MKKSFRPIWLMALPMMLGLASCASNDVPVVDTVTEVDPESVEFNPEVLTMATLYVADGVDADLRQAFKWGCATEDTSPEWGDVLLLNKLTDVSEDVLKHLLEYPSPNFLICLVNPVKAEIDAFAENHDWFDIETDNVDDDLLIYAFNTDNHRYLISQPAAEEGGDPILANLNRAQMYYVHISAMLSDFAQNQENGSKEKDKEGKTDMEDFANALHYSVTYPFTSNHLFREVLWSDADYLSGGGSMTANYDIYMVHVYEGEPGAGDYYGVKMTASIANAGMWKGKGWNKHGGVRVRWCGASCRRFYAESHLISSMNANWFEDLTDRLMFTSGGYPSPSTTVGQTSYEDKNSFSLSMSQSVGGEISKESKGAESSSGAKGSLDFSFSESWEWSHTESRTISDVDITNMTQRGNWAAWALYFNNLPEFKWSEDYGYDIKNNQASRGTMEIHTSWLWYDSSGKDNEDRAPYVLCTYMDVEYEMWSFISTAADNKQDTWKIYPTEYKKITLPKMVNTTAGPLKIVNDLPDGMTISNIKVLTTDNQEASEFENTVPNGGERVLGAYNTKYQYIVTFKGKTRAGKVSNYKYTLNPSIKVNHKETTVVYAASDFKVQK